MFHGRSRLKICCMLSEYKVGVNLVPWLTIKLCAENRYPAECCGFLWGHDGRITVAAEADNVTSFGKLQHFEIHANAFIAAERFADENGLTLMGVFHSHPDGVAEPSVIDRKLALPNFAYLILSVRDQAVSEARLWILDHYRDFKELRIDGAIIESLNT